MHGRVRKLVILSLALCGLWAFGAGAIQEAEPNDATPQQLGTLAPSPTTTLTVAGSAGYAGDLDWYAFEVPADARQTVQLATESSVGWQIILYSDSLKHLASGADSLTQDLAPGVYRVRIQQSDLGQDTYVFLVSNALERESNDGLAEAMPLGSVQTDALTAFASIQPVSDVDFFSFVVPEGFSAGTSAGGTRMLRIETPCPQGDTVLILYAHDDALGHPVPVARNDDSGSGSWSRLYLTDPRPGTYVLRVHEYADNSILSTYRVVVTPMDVANTEPNDSAAQASPLGSLEDGTPLTTTQFAGQGDVDMFSFSLAAPLCVLCETGGASNGDTVICLYDERGNEIVCDDDAGDGFWSRILRKLDAGRYVVAVRAADADAEFDYTLTLRTTPCPTEVAESEPNNTVQLADLLTLPSDATGEVAPGNPDVYTFVLASPATILCETYGAEEGDTTLCLLGADGETIACDDDGGSGLWSSLDAELAAGTYYLRVELYAGKDPAAYHLLVRLEE